MRACGRRHRRSAARTPRGSTGTPRCAGAPRCREPWLEHAGAASDGERERSARSCSLANLPGDVLALVADPLALVGLGLALFADDRRDLADLLLGCALDDDPGGLGHLELDPV